VPETPPTDSSTIIPYLLYEDVDAALEWLVDTFGFTEHYRMRGSDGRSNHAELRMGRGTLMIGNPGPDYKNPSARGGATQIVYVYVDDVDAHHAVALAKGAHILSPLADQFYGDRTYAASDPEGHEWCFAQHVRDVTPEDMHP